MAYCYTVRRRKLTGREPFIYLGCCEVRAHRHYANAPITEGLIDLGLELPSDVEVGSLDAVFQHVKGEYPTREERTLFEGRLLAGAQLEASAKQTKVGYLFRSTDGKRVLQVRLDGFTFSRLKPYENWAALRDEARGLWGTYRELVRPIKVTRVAVRYINQIDVPMATIELKDYFRTFPEVSSDLSQDLGAFLMQLQIPQADLDAVLVLTQTGATPPRLGVASVILDIGLFREHCEFRSDDEVWEVLESFRDRKNEVFEGCITDKARHLFGPATQ
jgi:uncharacterized protein (TIGR04255 family)